MIKRKELIKLVEENKREKRQEKWMIIEKCEALTEKRKRGNLIAESIIEILKQGNDFYASEVNNSKNNLRFVLNALDNKDYIIDIDKK